MKHGLDTAGKRVPVILLGIGSVGASLLKRLLRYREYHVERYGIIFDVVSVADSSGALTERDGPLSDNALREAIEVKNAGLPLSRIPRGYLEGSLDVVSELCGPGVVLVDCTASSKTQTVLLRALELGGKLVLANKRPLTQAYDIYCRLTRDCSRTRWETTVGASLPVIDSLNRINSCGDQVSRISGSFSGTIGMLMTSLEEGKAFGEAIRSAHAAGYTEPDAREDLSGRDVARKALILARGAGWKLNLADIKVESLVPEELVELSPADFLKSAGRADSTFALRVEACRKRGRILRYVASVQPGDCRVGLDEVTEDSPLGRLKGNDNLAEIHSELFSPNPLIIQGRGAGVEATAAGVLSDLIELA